MAGRLQGAYVQAWVYVEVEDGDEPSDEELRAAARTEYGEEGRIELDEGAEVSRSYVGG